MLDTEVRDWLARYLESRRGSGSRIIVELPAPVIEGLH